MTKQDTTAAVIGLLIIVGGGAALAATDKKGKTPAAGGKPPSPDDDGRKLMARANQAAALKWAAVFTEHPVAPLTAAALARWTGIESSGNPLSRSSRDERGLLQIGPTAVQDGEFPADLWDHVLDPKNSARVQADFGVAYADSLFNKVIPHLAHVPADPIDRIWYAKLYHQRPVDVRDGHLTGDATEDARRLATEWAHDAKAMHRLRAANVVAWGTPTP